MATLKHFTHLQHPLTEVSENKEFKCDGCGKLGIGKRYQCMECSFNLHLHCGNCFTDLDSFMHVEHRVHLTLVQGSRATVIREHVCEVCGGNVGGLFYRCKRCNFYLHPLCSQLPHYVHHTADTTHILELRKQDQFHSCAVCQVQCSSWYSSCGTCSVSLHIDCLLHMFAPSRTRYVQKDKATLLSSWLKKKRSTCAPWWWYCISFVLVVQLLYLILQYLRL